MRVKFSIKGKVKKKEVLEDLKRVLFKSMIKMHELAVINCPVDTGRLRNSINLKPSTPGYKEYTLVTPLEYAGAVEYGTIPHYTSPENIKAWSRRVLGNEGASFAVAAKIGKFGTEAQPFMRPALSQVRNIWIKRYMAQEFKK